MSRWRLVLIMILLPSSLVFAQNIIDHYSTIWPSGYGQMAFDGDTLYLNFTNGSSVGRYDISDPADPNLIDWEDKTGFEQIDFNRRVMATETDGVISLFDFSDFVSTHRILRLDLSDTGGGFLSWKYRGDAIFTVSADDTIRAYYISDPAYPYLSSSCGIIRRQDINAIFGSDLCISGSIDLFSPYEFLEVYDLRDPDDIRYSYTYPSQRMTGSVLVNTLKGDTISVSNYSGMSPRGNITIYGFSPVDTIPTVLFYFDGGINAPYIIPGENGFLIETLWGSSWRFYSLNNFALLGVESSPPSITFGIGLNNDVIFSGANFWKILQPSYSESAMAQIYSHTLDHYGVLSVCAYGDYILAGMESNGGELIVHSIGDDWDIFDSAYLPGVPAKDMIADGTTIMCLCDTKLVAVDFTDPGHPTIRHELTGLNGTLVDFAKDPNFYCVVTDLAYYAIEYSIDGGFSIVDVLDLPGAPVTSVVQYEVSYVMQGSIGTVIVISPSLGGVPYVMGEYRLPHENYNTLDLVNLKLWAGGPEGTDEMSLFPVEPLHYYSPEYFADPRRFYNSNDTLYVADGIAGIKAFVSNWGPTDTLQYIGSYRTGNVVNQIAFNERNFYTSDYYSLQHLRWGAPDAIGENPIEQLPDGFTLEQNYPNPFNSSTSIGYFIPAGRQSTIGIYDICGRNVRTIPVKGSGNIVWDGRDEAGKPVSSGVYFYMIAGQPETARKMLLVK